MRKKILIVLGVFVLLLAAVAVFAALQPGSFRVERSTVIAAPPAAVFAQVNDFHAWEAWSPWAKLDPAAKITYEGPAAGVGAGFGWDGNDEVGAGHMTILESRPGELIRIRLDFLRPFESTASAEFTFKPVGDATTVTWSMSGEKNFISKVFCLFASMDKMVGGDFEKGLAQMKAVTEAANKKP
jgi:uncharacterized protein YndB with AHSA1/START domain